MTDNLVRGEDPVANVSVSPDENKLALREIETQQEPGGQVSPESLVPRLGDYLLESRVISPDALERALDYQKSITAQGRQCLLGQALLELDLIDRETLDQAITKQLMSLHIALQDSNRQLERRVQQRTQDLERRLVQIRTSAEITQNAISAPNLDDLLQRTVSLIVERFGYYNAAIFLVDESEKYAVLRASSGPVGKPTRGKTFRLEIDSTSMVSWVLTNNQPRVASYVGSDPLYLKDENLPDTRSEVTIPIAMGVKVLGTLDVQHKEVEAFDSDAVAVLQMIANHIASMIQNFHLLEATQTNLREISTLYQASYQMARAETVVDVIKVVVSLLSQSGYDSVLMVAEGSSMRVVAVHQREYASFGMSSKPPSYPSRLPISLTEAERVLDYCTPFAIVSSIEETDQLRGLPEATLPILRQFKFSSMAIIPVVNFRKLEALMILGSKREGVFDTKLVQLYAGLAELTTTALEKAHDLQRMEKRLATLETINTIGQAVAMQTDVNKLYQVVHNEVSQIMGGVNFAVADYDTETDLIRIPYMYDGVDVRSVDPFKLGEGLTSILIRTRQPLMLVEDTERKTRELGAKLVGKPAQSWLGVPLLVGGEAIGAIIVQDLEQEGRFDEDDQRLLEIIAAQVAVAVRNTRLLESIRNRAERERLLYDITSKIRSSPDMQTILATTATELGKVIGVQRATIEVGIEPENELPGLNSDSEQELQSQPSDLEPVSISREEEAENPPPGDST